MRQTPVADGGAQGFEHVADMCVSTTTRFFAAATAAWYGDMLRRDEATVLVGSVIASASDLDVCRELALAVAQGHGRHRIKGLLEQLFSIATVAPDLAMAPVPLTIAACRDLYDGFYLQHKADYLWTAAAAAERLEARSKGRYFFRASCGLADFVRWAVDCPVAPLYDTLWPRKKTTRVKVRVAKRLDNRTVRRLRMVAKQVWRDEDGAERIASYVREHMGRGAIRHLLRMRPEDLFNAKLEERRKDVIGYAEAQQRGFQHWIQTPEGQSLWAKVRDLLQTPLDTEEGR